MHCSRCALVLAAFSALASVATAGPWVYSGPGVTEATGVGYINAQINGNPTGVILNNGMSIADANSTTPWTGNMGSVGLKVSAPFSYTVLYPITFTVDHPLVTSMLAINEQRTIVGSSKKRAANGTDLGVRATRWSLSSSYDPIELNAINTDLAGVTMSKAVAINASGLIVGSSNKYSGNTWKGNRAVKWVNGSTTPTELPITPFNQDASGFSNTFAAAVNDAGWIVGTTEGYDNSQQFAGTRAIRWKPNNTYAVLNPLGYNANNQAMCEAIDINSANITVGESHKYDYNNNQAFVGTRAVRWAPDSISGTELGGLGGTTVDGTTYMQVSSISDSGLILGQSNKYLLGATIGNRAVYWNATGSTAANELPHLGTSGAGITHGMARSANADGVVVGYYEKYSGGINLGDRAVLWTTAGVDKVVDLNSYLPAGSGWTLTDAVGVTDTGWISGTGSFDPDGPGAMNAYERQYQILVPSAGTYGRGDANFDTVTNFDDLLILAQHYGTANPNHLPYVGDLNLDTAVNFDDLLIVAQHYGAGASQNGTLGEAFLEDWAMARAIVPEPSGLIAVGAIGFLARRRRA